MTTDALVLMAVKSAADRIVRLIQRADEGAFGQLFITDTRPERTRHLLTSAQSEVRYFRVGKEMA